MITGGGGTGKFRRYRKGMYEEVDKETKELLLDSLAERTLSGKQKWEAQF